jgi:uncharacterized protein
MIIERTSAPPPAETRMVDTTEKQNDEKQKKRREEKRREHDDMIHIYREGSYSDMLLHRGEGLKKTALIIIQWGWFYAGLFLLGIWVWQKRILQDIAGHLKFLKRVMWISLAVGLAGTSLSYLMRFVLKPSASRTLFTVIADILARHIGTVSFTIFLMAVIVLLARREKWERLLMPVAAVGRLAFSNYVFQTVLCTTFFYSYGFGMFGKTGPLANLFIIFIVWGIQVPLSVWWSRRFRFGPVEWLWRSLTYGKCQPMKLKESLY